jgi:sulfur dioxygenase
MSPIQLFDPASSTFTYVLFDENSTESPRPALIIDPVDDQLERDLGVLREHNLKLVWAIETHAHADHITSAGRLAEHAGAKTAAPQDCGITTASQQLKDGDVLRFGSQHLTALHTPGHTAGSMSFLWRSGAALTENEQTQVFTGDTLLIGGCGRTDFQSGSAEMLYHSITKVLFALPESTTVWPGHDYKGNTQTTIGAEKTGNARVSNRSLSEFVALMGQLNLPKPKRLDEAVPANQRSGLAALVRHDAGDADISLKHLTSQGAKTMSADKVQPAEGYAGDITPQTAFEWWQAGEAVLVDIRTDAERAWVGFVPGAVDLAWKQWPGMVMNPAYDEGIIAAVPKDKKVLLLCRSGLRSIPAAKRAAELGFEAYNILEGFEGDPDSNAHRNSIGGWRQRGLPWRQN